jgi:uncharacterized SAM-binding protein YcdF (DUF218 family)
MLLNIGSRLAWHESRHPPVCRQFPLSLSAVSIDRWARVVWDFHHLNHTLEAADCIFVLGSHDTRVAERGAEVFLAGYAPLVVFSGNLGALTSGMWQRPEAEIFADVAAGKGVPRERMLLETRSTNTGENVDFSRRLLAERGVHPRTAIAVQKPYMERRTLATFNSRWPELEVRVTSPQVDFDAYPNDGISREDVIHIMVGDFQRLIAYAEKGWSAPQAIPPEVMDAYQRLIEAGYTGRLIGKDYRTAPSR